MQKENEIQFVNIRPGVSILSVLGYLNYKPWFALAEFVDNAVQSFLDYQNDLLAVEGKDFKLRVSIELHSEDTGRIIIRDNAAGIHKRDFPRAFRTAEVPPDRTGLSEFGVGMKSAACYFANNWVVRTSALGEGVERTVEFDVKRIVQNGIEEIVVQSIECSSEVHYTEIVLTDINRFPVKKTLGKIKEHLTDIYRVFIREGLLELFFDGEKLEFQPPKILVAPIFGTNLIGEGDSIEWIKDIYLDFGLGWVIQGFAALRETASTANAGFALFRRNRLIEGSADDTYRPTEIFGSNNSFIYQRLFGELHIEGFEVSHTKDGFQWGDNESIVLEYLYEELNKPPISLLSQARNYRVSPKSREMREGAKEAAERTAEVVKKETPTILENQIRAKPVIEDPPSELEKTTTASIQEIEVDFNNYHWHIIIELSDDPGVSEWVDICEHLVTEHIAVSGHKATGSQVKYLGIRFALAHPFMLKFGGTEPDRIQPLLRVAVALALGEMTARNGGVKFVGTVRRNVNQLLREALSK